DLVLNRMIHNAVVLGLWRSGVPAGLLEVFAITRKDESEEEILMELPDGFWFRIDEAWFRLMQILTREANYLGLGHYRLFVNSAASEEDKPLLTRISIILSQDTVMLDASDFGTRRAWEPGIQILANRT